MASVNKVTILGNLGRDPEIRYLPSGDAVANITVATTDKYKDKQTGEQKEITEWHRINFFGRQAEVVGQYLKKGSQIYVEGSLRTRKWTDKDGQEKYSTEIRADNMQMLGSRQGMGGPGPVQGGGNGGSYNQGNPGQQSNQGQNDGGYEGGYDAGGYDNAPSPPRRPPPSRPAPAPMAAARPAPAPKAASGFDDMDDDIPF